jgi:hypothetical protein
MTALQPKTLKSMINSWNILFGGNRSDAEKAIICTKFYQALKDVFSNEAFMLAAAMVEKETRFFPTIKDIMDCRESVNQRLESRPDYSRKAIASDAGELSPEIIKQNEKRLRVIRDMLCGKMSIGEAVDTQKRLQYYNGND